VVTEAFIDTNVLIYLLSPEDFKRSVARTVVAAGGAVSVQVLNEFARVAQRKYGQGWDAIEDYVSGFREHLRIQPLTVETHLRALEIARAHQLGIFDANILAAAELAGCETVWSEDMQDGFRVPSGPVIRNPFLVP